MRIRFKDGTTPDELAHTACSAALELDRLSQGRGIGRIEICRVAKWLREELGNPPWIGANHSSVMLFEHALKDWKCEELRTTMDDVCRIAQQQATALVGVPEGVDVKRLVDFCLSLSRAAAAASRPTVWW